MKQIIDVNVTTRRVDLVKCKTDMLVVGRFSDAGDPGPILRALDDELGGDFERLARIGDFTGKSKTFAIVYGNGRIAAERVLLLGLGERKKVTLDTLRKAAGTAASRAVEMKINRMSLALHPSFADRFEARTMGRVIAEGVYFGGYRYDEFVTDNGNGRPSSLIAEIIDSDASQIRSLSSGVTTGAIVGRVQNAARTLANRPGNVIDPPALARAAQEMVRGLRTVKCMIFDEKKLQQNKMGGILAVGSGSENKPRLIVLKYTPLKRPVAGLPTVALVGKGITFDSGGISIKPAQDMDQMKLDKSGAISVMATVRAVAEMGLPINVFGVIPSAENLPSGTSFRPGDIVTTYSGKTVEILNTDAEGRMILCDAITYAVKQKCDVVVDIATLTGACMVALGTYKAGLMGNDDELIAEIRKAAEDSGESVWPLPCDDEYADEIKSKIADLKNSGSRWGGACTAAAFLRQFVGQTKWAHLDIAGMDLFVKPTEYASLGSTGFGVRLLTTYLMNLVEKKR
ncbi:MAG: leucyl aminopeptidase [Phycisphaerae bacterium]|nr:leucyl aminopeptidase [Phycisphaerae bacterium]